MPWRPRMMPPVGKSGPGMMLMSSSMVSRPIAVDRAEIALPVDQRHAHGEFLRYADHRVVDRLVAMRMVFTDDVTDDARGLHVFLVGRVPLLVHGIKDAAMHRLEAV